MTISYGGRIEKLMSRWKGSLWKSCWKEVVVFLTFYYTLNFTYRFGLNAEQREVFEKLVIQFNGYTKQIPITFLLGFYVSSVVSRWWQQFENVGWPEDIMTMLSYAIPDNDKNPDARKKRRAIARYITLTQALCWRDLSKPVQMRFPTIHHFVDAHLMTEAEYTRFTEAKSKIKWFMPLKWVQGILQKEEKLPPNVAMGILKELNTFRNSLRKLYNYDWVVIPLAYTQVATLVTYTFFGCCVIGRQIIDTTKGYKETDFTIDIYVPIYTIIQILFFTGWFRVAGDLLRPFGDDDDDIELNYILDRNLDVSLALVDEFTQDPPELCEDPLVGEPTIIPHTKMSWGVKAVLRGPKQHFNITKNPDELKLVEQLEISVDENDNNKLNHKKAPKHQKRPY